ncbi:MAG: prolyl oligopeptidase family serine peptidase [Chlorobi bacterium]|nr:prolyl oligopeptidase family serine peptidase [Chlorobiota bacterium]
MQRTIAVFLFTIISIQLFAQKPEPTIAMRIDSIMVLHGDTTHDYYGWMHGKNNRNLINHLYAENAYADRVMKSSWLLQKRLYEEQRATIKDEYTSDSTLKENYWYYYRYKKDLDYPIRCRRKDTIGAKEQIYFDGNKLAEKYSYFDINTFSVSPNQKLLAYGINNDGSDKGYLFIKDIDNDSLLKEEIPQVSSFIWVNDSVFLYLIEDKKTHRADKMYRHTLGFPVENDSLIWYEPSKDYGLGFQKTTSKEYILVTRSNMIESECYYVKTKTPYGRFRLFQKTIPGKDYSFDHYKGDSTFYINTDWGNENGKLMQCPINNTKKENWTDLINLPDSLILRSYFVYRNHLVYTVNKNGLNHIIIRDRKTGKEKSIEIPGDNYVLGLNKYYGYDSLKFDYGYSTMVQPGITHNYDLITGKDTIVKQDTLEIKYDPEDYETRRLWATAKDGAKVPMDIVYRKGIKLDGSNPTLLYAYAMYGYNQQPWFSEDRLIYLDRGFIYAIAHPRGSSFLGEQWHTDGKLMKKRNTYTDFIACAELLIDSGYTSNKKLAIKGGSAGGMLMGAAVTMRPDLFKCVIPNVPFVDVLYEMQDTTWPGIIPHFNEIGNPFIKEEYDYIKSWCPYQNIRDTVYPDILVTSGLNDSRVPVWSPAKWVSKLRYHKTDTNLLLFKTAMNGGHGGGATGRYSYLKEASFELAFIMRSLGIKEEYLTIQGKVYDSLGEILPFVNIYVKGTSQGTTSNFDGEFSLDLQKGTSQTIVFQYVGFKKVEVPIDINTKTSDLIITLPSEAIMLSQVTITSDGEDPAYAIIKNAQNQRKKHLKQLDEYSVDIYIKGVGRLNETPEKIPAFMKNWELPDSTDIGLLNLSESVAKYFYRAPDDYKEKMIASKVAGTNRGYSWNRAKDIMLNFYENNIPMGWFGERGFISPIASSAIMYYRYKLVDIFNDNDKIIYKIQVTPRRKHDPVFRGFVYIVDNDWSFYSLDLVLTKEANLKMIDSLEIRQTHIPLNDSIWMPFTIEFKQYFKIFGFGGYENSVGTFSNYNLHPNYGEKFFNNEIFRIEDEANKKDSVYWDKSRYVVLTDEESSYYHKEDSILLRKKDPEYLDSLKKANNKFKFGSVLWKKYEHKNYVKNMSWYIDPLIAPKSINYNTVEGWVLQTSGGFALFDKKEQEEEHDLWFWYAKHRFMPRLKYSITNKELYGDLRYYFGDIFSQKMFYVLAGRTVANFAQIDKTINTVYSLFLKENYAKYYKMDYFTIGGWKRIIRGLSGHVYLKYERRYPMVNNAGFSFYDYFNLPDKEFISNNPLNPNDDSPGFEKHDVFIANFNFTIKFKQKYSTYPNGRIRYHDSKYPTVFINYKHGFYVSDSRNGFDFAQIAVSDKIKMGLFGQSVYTINVGGFFSGQNQLEYIDYNHFQGNQTIFLKSSWGIQSRVPFNTLNYFDYSTNEYYASGRWEHHFNGWIFNKLPLLRKLKFQVLAGTASLYSTDNGVFSEFFVGAENIFNFLRVDFVTNYQNNKINPMLRIGLDVTF